MKVLNVFYNFTQGGVERLGISVANSLAKKCDDSYVCIINDQRDENLIRLFDKNVKILLLNKVDHFRKLGYLKQIIRLIKREGISVMHVHQGTLMSFFLVIKILCPSLKVYFTVHDTYIYSELSSFNRQISKIICNKIIAISDGVVADIQSHGVQNGKICRIYNGVDFSKFDIRKVNIPNGDIVIANVARFFPKKKGQDVLIRAFAELVHRGLSVRLKLAGGELYDGEGSIDKMKTLARNLGVEDRIEFLGNVTDVNQLLQQVNIFCIPSNYEGFGISAVEAMGTGLPCVASDIVGLNEVVNDEELGKLFAAGNYLDLADKLISVISFLNEYIPQRIAENVRERFSIETMTDNLIKVYTE